MEILHNYFYNHLRRGSVSEEEYALAVDSAGTVYCLNQKSGLSYYDAKMDSFRIFPLPGRSSGLMKLHLTNPVISGY